MIRLLMLAVLAVGVAQARTLLAERFLSRQRRDSATPEIRYLHIRTDVAYRFATTKVASMLANKDRKAREAVFTVQLPKSAFITQFSMTIEDIVYNGTVKAKEVARQEYIEAKRRGQSAGHVAARTRNANKFDVSVNVASQQKVTFNLTYQELLQRSLGKYQNVIYINPGQFVPDLKIDVLIDESREITTIRVPELRKDVEESINSLADNTIAVVQKSTPKSARISYHPSLEQQKEINAAGLSGQFIVQYDVARNYDAGDIQVVDGYFVHFFAPSGLDPVKKNVIFILDVSGSMSGRKIQQVRDAMKVILRDLQPGDLFNIVLFDHAVEFWNTTTLLEANAENLRDAEEYVRGMRTRGSTNINDALLESIRFLDDMKQQEKALNPSSIIVFLTDGDPTSGVTNTDSILRNVRSKNEDRYSIFSLGFGDGVDFNFLRKISLQNSGVARKIYADSDATLQLQGFYKEISCPVLTDVNVDYLDIDNTTKVTRRVFPNYFNGSEIVICGTYTPKAGSGSLFRTVIRGKSDGQSITMEKELDVTSRTGLRASTEKLWAYMTIKELLDKSEACSNATEKEDFKAEALRLSLKYSFVTPLTSMIVKKPDQNATRSDLTDDRESQRPYRSRAGYGGPMNAYSSGPGPVSGLPGPVGYGGSSVGSASPYLFSSLAYQPNRRRKAKTQVNPRYHTAPVRPRYFRTYAPTATYASATAALYYTSTWMPTTAPPTTTTPRPRVQPTFVTIRAGLPSITVEVSGQLFCFNWPISTSIPQLLFRDSRKQTVITGQFEEINGVVVLTKLVIRNEAYSKEVTIETQSVADNSHQAVRVSSWDNMRSDSLVRVLAPNKIQIGRHVLSNSISLDIVRKQLNSNFYLVVRIKWQRRSSYGLSGLLRGFMTAKLSPSGDDLYTAPVRKVPAQPSSVAIQDFVGQQRTCKVYARYSRF